jgi:signal transduction histidine kinase
MNLLDRVEADDLLYQAEQARAQERRRIARDLHDRLGDSLSAALRQLELHEIASGCDAEQVKDSLAEAMRRLRVVLGDLRPEPVCGLKGALTRYLDSMVPEPEVRMAIEGDEAWVPGNILYEAFLIIKEAIRNVLRHSGSATLQISVTLARHELRAQVEDDGRGFLPGLRACSTSSENGLLAMRERADLIGGRLTVCSAPGNGTLVRLRVPLRGCPDE